MKTTIVLILCLCSSFIVESQIFFGEKNSFIGYPDWRWLKDIDVVDFDLDGDIDVLGTSEVTDEIFCYLNIENSGNFENKLSLITIPENTISFKSKDLNDDGWNDLIYATYTTIFYVLNEGANTFAAPIAIVEDINLVGYHGFDAIDVNMDGDLDIVVSLFDSILLIENLNNLEYATPQDIAIGGEYDLGDFDSDGDPDLIVADFVSHGKSLFSNRI